MTIVVPSIVQVLMNKITLRISIHANDWTAKSAIISGNTSFIVSLEQLDFS